MRLDKFLKVSRLIKRRTVANEACDAGRVLVNDKTAKASLNVKEGDIIEIGFGTKAVKVEVLNVQETVKKEEAKPAKKAYASKEEISAKKQPAKKAAAKPAPKAEPLGAPSVLDDEPAEKGGESSKEGEFEGGNIQTDFANFPYPWYITQVRNSLWIEWEKRRPAGSTLAALVTFAIARDGKVKDLKVERKSGDDTFDFAASSAVINAGPFAPLPMYYEKDELTVSVEFKQEK